MNICDIVKNAGVVGEGGAGFPTHVKLNTNVDYYIINAAECEPLIEVDKFLMRQFPDEIIKGIEAVAESIGAKNKCIAIKAKYKKEISILREAIKNNNSDIYFYEMETFYPAGDEHLIVYEVTGKPIPERGLPLDVSSVVNNVGTVLDIYNSINNKQNVTYKYLSVVGEVKENSILHVPIGTSVVECINMVGSKLDEYSVMMGGPMMGKVYSDMDEIKNLYISKKDGNILVLPKDHYLVTRNIFDVDVIKSTTKSSCIQCRFCTDFCPRYLIGHDMRPHHVMRNLFMEEYIDNDEDYIKSFGTALNCSECGICELFACPMHISPRKVNIYMKNKLKEKGLDVPRNLNPVPHDIYDYRKIPTDSLISRLDLSKYKTDVLQAKVIEFVPDKVHINLSQHIGAPADVVVNVGDVIKKGDLVGVIPEGKLGANIHCSIDGLVEDIQNKVVIVRRNYDN